jgi:hypothetical protein
VIAIRGVMLRSLVIAVLITMAGGSAAMTSVDALAHVGSSSSSVADSGRVRDVAHSYDGPGDAIPIGAELGQPGVTTAHAGQGRDYDAPHTVCEGIAALITAWAGTAGQPGIGGRASSAPIFDLKTGSAMLTSQRIAQIRANLPPGYQDIPIIEYRP